MIMPGLCIASEDASLPESRGDPLGLATEAPYHALPLPLHRALTKDGGTPSPCYGLAPKVWIAVMFALRIRL
jgi:hypothetical protein